MTGEKKTQSVTARLASITRALHHRNFRLFFSGQSISLVGTWMQRVALSWLVYDMTHSAFLLGVVGFSGRIPSLLVAPLGGVLADRWNRHRSLVVTQAMAMVQAIVLAVLVLTGKITVWEIIVLSIFLGVINAFDAPIRQSFMLQMVGDKKDLGNAIALNSSMVNGARLLGPTAAGVLIAALGEGACFLINAISYLPVIASLLMMRLTAQQAKPRKAKVRHELKDGFTYAFRFTPVRAILLMLALVSLMGMPYTVLMPVFAKDILHGGPKVLGFLMGASGVGALAGALYLASKKNVLGLGKLIAAAAATFGVGLMVFSFSRLLILSLLLMLLVGVGQMIQLASSNTLLQTIVDDDKRGRIMSFYAMAFMGMAPIGSLIAGSLASKIGAPWTVRLGGLFCIVGAVIFARKLPALRKLVRPTYVRMGILPEIAHGIQSASDLPSPDKREN